MEPYYVNSNNKAQELKTNLTELFFNPRPKRHSSNVEVRNKIKVLLKDYAFDMNALQYNFCLCSKIYNRNF